MKFYRKTVDINKFTSDKFKQEALYGLNPDVKFCSKCLMSNQRPNMTSEHNHTADKKKDTIKFHEGNICDACKYAERKKISIDWDKRKAELHKLLDKYRSKDGSYDVIVPASGGKDSFYVAHRLKYEFGMHPLTCTFAPNIFTSWGFENQQNLSAGGFTNYLITCNTKIHRFITRLATENLLHPFQPWILGQKNFPIKFAIFMKIPLIFYGENPAEYGNPNEKYYDDMQLQWHACKDVNKIQVAGIDLKDLKENFDLKNNELEPYIPTSEDDFKKNKIKCVAFSFFDNWHPQKNYYYTVENSNFKPSPERTLGTYSKYASIDDKIDDMHYYTTHIKFGIGRTHYDVAQEIRCGDLTTEEGRSLIKKFDGEYPSRFFNEVINYLSIDKKDFGNLSTFFEEPVIDKEYFDNLMDAWRSPHIWKFTNNGWVLRNKPYED